MYHRSIQVIPGLVRNIASLESELELLKTKGHANVPDAGKSMNVQKMVNFPLCITICICGVLFSAFDVRTVFM